MRRRNGKVVVRFALVLLAVADHPGDRTGEADAGG